MLRPGIQLARLVITEVLVPRHMGLAKLALFHGDASLYRTHEAAQVAPDTEVVDDRDLRLVVCRPLCGDRLVRSVLARYVAEATIDALVLIDARLDDVVDVEALPIRDLVDRQSAKLVDTRHALAVEVVRQAFMHTLNDSETVMHHSGSDLNGRRPQKDVLSNVLPGGDSAYAADRESLGQWVRRDRRNHVESDRLHRGPAIPTMTRLFADHRSGYERVEVDAGNGIDRVDQAHRVGTTVLRCTGSRPDIGDIGSEFHEHRAPSLKPSPNR